MAASRNNVRKRGSTWTYYLYVTDGAGERRQKSKGGFATRKEAEAARVEALAALSNGNWVQPDRLTVAEFLTDEWLPTQRPPTLEESTYASYARNIRLHVVPYGVARGDAGGVSGLHSRPVPRAHGPDRDVTRPGHRAGLRPDRAPRCS